MTASIALNNALSGLNVNQQALTVLSQNIANANTPGYSAQTINQQAVSPNGVDSGVSIESITRKIDAYLTTAAQTQNSIANQAGSLNDYYSKIQLLLGTPGNNNSIDSYVNTFFNSVQALGQSPNDSTLQQGAVTDGATLATQVNQLALGLNGLQFQADQDINNAVQTVNNDLTNINQLNHTITSNLSQGQSVANLQDQRDTLITDIAKYMNVNTIPQADGSLFLTTGGGVNLLNDSLYQIAYTPANSVASFSNNAPLGAMTISPVNDSGTAVGTPVILVTGGTPSQVTTVLTTGSLAALTSMRDQIIPNITSQLDSLASSLRDQVNAITNAGSSYPGANSLTGTTLVNASQTNQWAGTSTIALVNSNGQPIPSPYPDEGNGMQSLNLNLSTLDTGSGAGNPSVQGIINAINQYYGAPQNKAEVGNLNNIQLVSNTAALPNAGNTLNLGFNLNNISGTSSNFYVSNMSIVATDIGGGTSAIPASTTVPTVALDPANTYTTANLSNSVIVGTTGTSNGLTNGEVVYLSTPPAGPDAGGTYGGIAPSNLSGYFTVSNVTSNSFTITANQAATLNVTDAAVGQTATPPYTTAPTGTTTSTQSNGTFTADVSGDPAAIYYTVTATVGVDNGSGTVVPSQITYQVYNNQASLLGTTFGAQTASGTGKIVAPTTLRPAAFAELVDANGVELPKINGQYTTTQNGYLEIKANNSSTFVAINSGNSKELGLTSTTPAGAATNKGFSDYFNLNGFFQTGSSYAVAGSAANLTVEQRLQDNSSLLSLGQLSQGPQPVSANVPPNYTLQLNPGDGTIAQQLAALGAQTLVFPAAGGLGQTSQTFSGYVGEVIGNIATDANNANTTNTNAQSLLTSYNQQNSAISGVNLDKELANTVIYQNAYAASARVITVTSTLFDSLLQAFS